MIQWIKYVPHGKIIHHLAKGWVVVDDLYGTNHGFYSCLMRWAETGSLSDGE